MCDAACGEPIARAGCRLNVRDRAGAGTLKGLSRAGSGYPEVPGGARRELIDTPGRRRVGLAGLVRRSAWEESGRNPGPGTRRETLGGRSPREQPAVGELTPVRSPGMLGRVKAQKPRPVGPALASATGAPTGGTARGSTPAETRRVPFERSRLRRANPKSAAGMKQNRQGLGGRKPPRG
jgi:hypothetical protein